MEEYAPQNLHAVFDNPDMDGPEAVSAYMLVANVLGSMDEETAEMYRNARYYRRTPASLQSGVPHELRPAAFSGPLLHGGDAWR